MSVFYCTLQVRSSYVYNVTCNNITILFVEGHPLLYNSFGLWSVIQYVASVTSRHPIAQVLGECPLVFHKMVLEGLEHGCSPTPMIYDNRNEHPALGRNEMKSIIIHSLQNRKKTIESQQSTLLLCPYVQVLTACECVCSCLTCRLTVRSSHRGRLYWFSLYPMATLLPPW